MLKGSLLLSQLSELAVVRAHLFCNMKVSKGAYQKQQNKSGDTIFHIISLLVYFSDAQGQLTP